MNAPIGVIDSGVGGLTVAKEIIKRLPNETIYYIGDTARCPYGPRTRQEVRNFTWQMAKALEKMNIKMLVIACNTATAVALESLQRNMPFPVLGVINAGARAAVKKTKRHEVVVLATEGTIKSGAYEEALLSLNTSTHIIPLACPTFVPLVESGEYKGQFANNLIAEGLKPLKNEQFDTVILGCTHYPILQKQIEAVVGEDVFVLSSAEETAKDVEEMLAYNGTLADTNAKPAHKFYATGSVPIFRSIAENWLEQGTLDIHRITLK
ncbi:glutamate racemase [Lysinibacillus sphaericus]|uniref:Glutamate racemase n=4 Tax=Lysinibacillus TaxID=400634 RepID=A0A2S5CXD0_LYSSH|nr:MULTISPECIES: glutamate racemase [Lysinibacillus]AHN22808.1 glutamate racemase [Lysinibacillus varians]AVK95975.1 glutamate racemase [Lysinibacillus sphaericus]MCS1380755.1 glutamate racemase [Lysinibacillus sphaericus]MED4545055.1 glutamate racemase [Lysinibacillus sphaericus]OEC00139.1 glutamate racemase [Lysinibacillus sphaericus]